MPARIIVSLILSLLLLRLSVLPVSAASEFSTVYDTSYEVTESGLTRVVHHVSLTNNLSNIYADQYSISIGLPDLQNIEVRDSVGKIAASIIPTDNQTTVRFRFVDKVVGKNKTNNFTVSYDTKDIVQKNGSVWELNIPKLDITEDITAHTVSISIPSSFGRPAFINPKPSDIAVDNLRHRSVYSFSSLTVKNKPISAVFGTVQYMDFSLDYHISNSDPLSQKIAVPIPPDTNYQQILIKSIDPMPLNIDTDADGNWLAVYSLEPKAELDITVNGIVKLSFNPRPSPITPESYQQYLSATDLWPVGSAEFVELGQKLKTPSSIYQYVYNHLSYDYTKINSQNLRLGGLEVLRQPQSAICTDFSDLFITISRSAGIPARELEGYAFTANDKLRPLSLTQDILHSWVEYYDSDKQMWIQIDPTWAKTTAGIDYFSKLDLNHFVFVIHGLDAKKPAPAGAYKRDAKTKDVRVVSTSPIDFPPPQLSASLDASSDRVAVTFINNSPVSADFPVSVQSAGIINQHYPNVYLPPFSSKTVDIQFVRPLSLSRHPVDLTLTYGNQTASYPITLDPYIPQEILLAAAGGFAVFLAVSAFFARRLYLRRRRQMSSLYW